MPASLVWWCLQYLLHRGSALQNSYGVSWARTEALGVSVFTVLLSVAQLVKSGALVHPVEFTHYITSLFLPLFLF